ncbi:MAG: hypothetical protein M9951_03335 [Burkholderiaceae bacterium]|nr:hypothetical protein [Burkholderiaceae bacterium]MEB2317761.1 hypothetical protein [Pseudomonadota bacterium]
MPLTVRLIASTNGASIGNTLRTPKMKNGPSSPLFEKAGFEVALGSGRQRQSRLPRGPVVLDPAAREGLVRPLHDFEFDQPAAPTENALSSSRLSGMPIRHADSTLSGRIPETAQKPGDFSSARL